MIGGLRDIIMVELKLTRSNSQKRYDMSRPSLKSAQNAVARAVIPRLFVLELNAGRIHSMNTDGSNRKTIVSDCHLPDGIVVDAEAGHIYWTNMGIPNLNDGSVERADIDGIGVSPGRLHPGSTTAGFAAPMSMSSLGRLPHGRPGRRLRNEPVSRSKNIRSPSATFKKNKIYEFNQGSRR